MPAGCYNIMHAVCINPSIYEGMHVKTAIFTLYISAEYAAIGPCLLK